MGFSEITNEIRGLGEAIKEVHVLIVDIADNKKTVFILLVFAYFTVPSVKTKINAVILGIKELTVATISSVLFFLKSFINFFHIAINKELYIFFTEKNKTEHEQKEAKIKELQDELETLKTNKNARDKIHCDSLHSDSTDGKS